MWNPTRRSKNIGTPKQGYGQNNKLTIPAPCAVSKSFYERLGTYNKIQKTINGHEFVFVIEETRGACKHSCSVSDVERIIENIPAADYGDLKLIIFRQPKKKEEILSPVWGRLIYSYEFEDDFYPAIIIEAVDFEKRISWSKSQTPDIQQEFNRLKLDGHDFIEGKRAFTAALTPDNVRNTQLYRTLIHEFGHYVQYLEVVERCGTDDEDIATWEKRNDEYQNIPKNEKESYAHRYAEEVSNRLRTEKVIPFNRLQLRS